MTGHHLWRNNFHLCNANTLRTLVTVLFFGHILCSCTYSNSKSDAGASADDRIVTPNSSAIVGPLKSDLVSPEEAKTKKETAEKVEAPIAKISEPKAKVPPKVKEVEKKMPVKKSVTKTGQMSRKAEKKIPPAPKQPIKRNGSVSGRVSIVGKDNAPISPRGVLLDLKPIGDTVVSKVRGPVNHDVDMKNKTYLPRHLTIQKQDRVSFLNKDRIKHNVFSSTGANAFDLGTYSAGKKREVTLQESGVVKVYCNIHAEMATFISVSEVGLNTISTDDGSYTIKDVPPGEYELHAWHIRGETTQKIVITSNTETEHDINLNTADYKRVKHQNKFGKKYNKNSALFDDEFY